MSVSSDHYERITSATNPLIKLFRSLGQKKKRMTHNAFLAEGARLITEGIINDWPIEAVLIGETAAELEHIQSISTRVLAQEGRVVIVNDRLLRQLSHKDNPQNILGMFRQRRIELKQLPNPTPTQWLALYQIRDPGNLGTIIRTADCAGAGGVILLSECCDPYSLEAVRASMGSIFSLPIATSSFSDFNIWRKAGNMPLIGTSLRATQRLDQVVFGPTPVILMGNEQSGLPESIEAECDHILLIPMRGGADSLNIASAAAITLYEAWRQEGYHGTG